MLCVALAGCVVFASDEAVIGCQVADTITTVAALERGAVEANPLMERLLDSFGLPGFVLAKIAITWALVWYMKPEPGSGAEAGRAAVSGLTCAAAINNYGVIRGLR